MEELVGFCSHPVFRRTQSVNGCWRSCARTFASSPAGLEKTRAPRAGLPRLSPPDDHCPLEATGSMVARNKRLDVFRILV
jgi:hypothetical protein